MRRHAFALCAASALLGAVAAADALTLPSYDIVALGLTDAEHTLPNGYHFSTARRVTASGYVTGTSQRYDSFALQGTSAWLYDAGAGTTTRIGLFDPEHTQLGGSRSSATQLLTESGYAAGGSARYIGAQPSGSSAWLYAATSGTTTRLGFTDPAHTATDGTQSSVVRLLAESGLAAGSSTIYSGVFPAGQRSWLYDTMAGTTTRIDLDDAQHSGGEPNFLTDSGYVVGTSQRDVTAGGGQSSWLYNASAGTTTRLGYFDAAHTDDDGHQSSDAFALTESGNAIGRSNRYAGPVSRGTSAWLYAAASGTTTRLGFTDAAHTATNGTQGSVARLLTESGLAAGFSTRFSGATNFGSSAWLYDVDAGATQRLGFTDAAHTRSDGTQSSDVVLLSESGYVTGFSTRYGATTSLGSSAWLYDPTAATTTRIGLFDAEHTRSGGFQSSRATFLADSGYVAGTSSRYNGGSPELGESAWLYDPAAGATARLGLADARHTRGDGYQRSLTTFITDSGFVAGLTERFGAFTETGWSAWIYDANTGTQHSIVLSERSDGFASAFVSFLGEEGFALGSYSLFDAADTALGLRAFAWTAAGGVVDLGALVDGGLGAAGWSYLEQAVGATGLAQIIGNGHLTSGDDLAFLMVAAPEPSALALLLGAGLGALCVRRSRG